MMTRRLLVALTVLNFGLLIFLVTQAQTPEAHGAGSVLRGRALEIVDDQGRVRASIQIHPAGAAAGKAYAETVILRLIDPSGRPSVKLAGSTRDAGLSLVGEGDSTYVVLKAEEGTTSLKLTNKIGQERVVTP